MSPTSQLRSTWPRRPSDHLTVWLWDHVAISIWSSAWTAHEAIGYHVYRELLTMVATTLIDQWSDPDGPVLQLHVAHVDRVAAR